MTGRGDADLLASGRAFADLASWRKIAVTGADAMTWLNDLVSADISGLAPGRARRSLLLSPTGHVRAEFTVAVPNGDVLLLQDPVQRGHVGDLLSPYVLSSDVALEERTEEIALFAFPGRSDAPDSLVATVSTPSCLGDGVDLLAPIQDRSEVLASLERSFTRAHQEEVEAWRVAAGIPRVGVDVREEDLPQDAGLTEAVSFDKGCYLGQEAIAKVRNLGHPRRVLLRLEASEPVAPGELVEVDGSAAGEVTSVARAGGTVALARIRWDLRKGPFRTSRGTELRVRPRS